MKTNNSLSTNIILNICKTGSTLLFPLVSYMYVARIFGAEGYGHITFAKNIVWYFLMLAMLGIYNYGVSEVARVKDNKDQLNVLCTSLFIINVIAMMVSYCIMFLVIINSRKLLEYKSIMLIYSIEIILQVIGMEWVYVAFEKFKYITIRTFVFQIVCIFLIIILVRKPSDALIYVMIQVIALAGSNIINFICLKNAFSFVKVTAGDVFRHLKPVLLLFIMLMFVNIFRQMDTLMIGVMKGDKEVGLYAAGDKASSIISGVVSTISATLLPRIALLEGRKSEKELRQFIFDGLDLLLFVGVPTCIGIMVLAEPIVIILCGNDYLGAVLTTRILSLRVILAPINSFFVISLFIPLRRFRDCLLVTGMAAIMDFVTNFMLIPKISYNGAAIATIMAEVVELALLMAISKHLVSFQGLGKKFCMYILESIPIVIIWGCTSLSRINVCLGAILVFFLSVIVYFGIQYRMKNKFVFTLLDKIGMHRQR